MRELGCMTFCDECVPRDNQILFGNMDSQHSQLVLYVCIACMCVGVDVGVSVCAIF